MLLVAALTCTPLAARDVAAARDVPSLDAPDLARGQYASMHTVIRRTILRVDVVSMDLRFGPSTRDRIARLARGRSYSKELAGEIARTVVEAERAVVQVGFRRNIGFSRWLEDVRKNLQRARDAGFIDEESYAAAYHEVPRRFRGIHERGFRNGDRLLYRARPNSLRTVLVAGDGTVLVDYEDRGRRPRRILLSGFFAPGIEPREPLIRSLFD